MESSGAQDYSLRLFDRGGFLWGHEAALELEGLDSSPAVRVISLLCFIN